MMNWQYGEPCRHVHLGTRIKLSLAKLVHRLDFRPLRGQSSSMTDTSSADPFAASGASSKSTKELKKLIEETVRSMKVANEPRPPEVAQAPVAKINIGWTGVGGLAAVVGLMFGAFFWLNDSISSAIRAESESIRAEIRAENESIRAEIGSIRTEIGDLRNDMREDFESVRAEIGDLKAKVDELNARMIRLESVYGDELPPSVQ